MGDLAKYQESIADLAGFLPGDNGVSDELGELIDRFQDSAGRPARALAFTFEAMKLSWVALPSDIRQQALLGLRDAGIEVLQTLGDQLGDVPLYGWIADVAKLLITTISEVREAFKANNEAWSKQDRNEQTQRTFEDLSAPTSWLYGQTQIHLYMRFDNEVGLNRWRTRPPIEIAGQAAKIFGLDALPQTGNCSPGKPYKSKGGGWEAKDSTSPCKAYAAVSALFYPYWSPVETTDPIPYYGRDVWPKASGFKDSGVDPNLVLIERQALLLSDPYVNLQASGRHLQKVHDQFLRWFEANAIVGVDEEKIEARDYQKDPPSRYYLDDNGLLRIYYQASQDNLASMDDVVAEWPGYAEVTAAQYNCVVGMTRAFFTARSAFLTNQPAMAAYVADGRVNDFGSDVRGAVREAAEGIVLTGSLVKPARVKKRPSSGGGGGGGAIAALVAVGGLAFAFLKR